MGDEKYPISTRLNVVLTFLVLSRDFRCKMKPGGNKSLASYLEYHKAERGKMKPQKNGPDVGNIWWLIRFSGTHLNTMTF